MSGFAVQIYKFDGLIPEDATCGSDGVAGSGTGGRFRLIEQYRYEQASLC